MKKAAFAKAPATRYPFAPLTILIAVLLAMGIFCPIPILAETASYEDMDRVCRNWLTYTVAQIGDWAGATDPRIIGVEDIVENDTLLARYYEIYPNGYIIVPALKNLPPVKAYSDNSRLDLQEADGFAVMLREVLQNRTRVFVDFYGSLEAVPVNDDQPLYGPVNRQRWDDFAVSSKKFDVAANMSLKAPTEGVGPLLGTSWHQGYPYNAYCPMGDGGRCVVGCVATAMAQIMWYHQWPPAGDGSHSYTWGGDNSCGGSTPSQVLSADFSDPYIYQNTTENLAEINSECGIAVNMDYGACASGAYFGPTIAAFVAYFRYANTINQRGRLSYSSQVWFEMVQEQINQDHPILYGISRHAIVCDGWRIQSSLNQYHMNYGWGGSQNAWYVVDQLHCDWEGCGLAAESMIRDIIPRTGSPWLGENELSDATFGDGDGVPEAGETIELTFTVANYGGAEVTDVEINMSVDDAEIILVDEYVYLGTIPGRDSVDNIGDPLVFEIPAEYTPRIDSFYLEISWNAGENIDTLYLVEGIGGAKILLVDDDDDGGVETYYKEALETFRVPYDTWIHSAYSSPDSAYLVNYDIVIWFVGDYQASPLNGLEISAMQGYLNAGGNLFLTGQGIAAQLDSYDPAFLNNYLRTEYQMTEKIPALASEPGCQVIAPDIMIAFQGGNSASNQDYPDLISPINGGVSELRYLGSDYFGAISYAGDYKLVFFSFGFEAVVSDDSRWHDRDSTMSDILNFFGHLRPNAAPMVSDLAVSPGEVNNMTDHTPEFSWNYLDIESSPQALYHFQVSTNPGWETADTWDYGPVSGSENQIAYAGAELIDGVTYYTRVRAYDGSLWSAWADLEIHMNSVPAAPTELTPADMQGMADATPELAHVNADDAEYDAITHGYEVYDDSLMTTLIASAYDQPSEFGSSSWTVDVALSDDQDYYWRVRGSDPYEDGEWSGWASFWINTDNQLPDPFDLVTPEDGASLTDLEPTFTWTASADSDLHDDIRYTLFYGTDPTFVISTTVGGLDATEYVVPVPVDFGEVYYWKVMAYDLFGGETMSDHTFTFATMVLGDANGDGTCDVADAVYIINFVFKSGPAPDPYEAGDANCDGTVNVGDAVYLIQYVFNGGPAPGCP
jgi:hypothetical protein